MSDAQSFIEHCDISLPREVWQLTCKWVKRRRRETRHGEGRMGANRTCRVVPVGMQKCSLPSRFSESLAMSMARGHGLGSRVHWGNDGFCIDVALAHPHRAGDVTIGVLCDSSRFLQAPDPVEWDLFRVVVHESQGWKLHRVWTPQFFRDAAGHLGGIAEGVQEHLLPGEAEGCAGGDAGAGGVRGGNQRRCFAADGGTTERGCYSLRMMSSGVPFASGAGQIRSRGCRHPWFRESGK